jgi:hypothetical protein
MKLSNKTLAVCLLGITSAIHAQNPAPEATAAPEGAPAKRPMLKYAAPKSAAGTGVRIDGDGGSRGTTGNLPVLHVLAPSGEALTTQKQPVLFYSQSGTVEDAGDRSLTFTLVEPNRAAPLIKAVAAKSAPGIRRVQVSTHGVELKAGVRYDWRVALGGGLEGRSLDVFASASIKYAPPSKELTEALAADPSHKAEVYAAHGIWYDALAEISNQIMADPKNPELLAQRAALLEQVGLGKVNWSHTR